MSIFKEDMFNDLEDDVSTKDVAITLKKLVPLFNVVNGQIKDLSTQSQALMLTAGKSFIKYQARLYKKVCKKSVKEILKKNPVNIEMPTLKKVGNGQIKKVPTGQKAKDIDEIEVHEPAQEVQYLTE